MDGWFEPSHKIAFSYTLLNYQRSKHCTMMKAPNSLLLSCILALAVRAIEFNPSQSCWTNVDPDYDFYPVKVQADHSQFWSVEYHNTYKIVKNLLK